VFYIRVTSRLFEQPKSTSMSLSAFRKRFKPEPAK
jgi:hypothetical protein